MSTKRTLRSNKSKGSTEEVDSAVRVETAVHDEEDMKVCGHDYFERTSLYTSAGRYPSSCQATSDSAAVFVCPTSVYTCAFDDATGCFTQPYRTSDEAVVANP